jgi:hypothetical protein
VVGTTGSAAKNPDEFMFVILGHKIVAFDQITVPPTRFDPFGSGNQGEWPVPKRSGIAFRECQGRME